MRHPVRVLFRALFRLERESKRTTLPEHVEGLDPISHEPLLVPLLLENAATVNPSSMFKMSKMDVVAVLDEFRPARIIHNQEQLHSVLR